MSTERRALDPRPRGSLLAQVLFATMVLSACSMPTVSVGDALALHRCGVAGPPTLRGIRLWISLGFAVAAVAFGAFFEHVGIGTILPTYAIVLLTLPLWSMLGTLPSARPARGQVHSRLGAVGAFFKAAPRLGVILRAMLLVAVGVSASFMFVPVRIGGLGAARSWSGSLWRWAPRSRSR